jgi:hypothetical protein
MTSNQITTVLNDLGISNPTNTWLKLSNISVLKISQDINIFIDKDSELYYFDSKSGILYSTFGDFRNYNKVETDLEAYDHQRIVPFDSLNAIICTTEAGPYGSYYNKKFSR